MTNASRAFHSLALLSLLATLSLPATSHAQHDDAVPWHQPSKRDTPPPEVPASRTVILEPAFGASAVGGRFYGYDPSLRLHFAGKHFGVHAGITSATQLNVRDWEGPLIYVGATLNPLGGIPLASPSPNLNLFLLGPRFNINASNSMRNRGISMGLGFTPTGLRVARCEPICMFAELRPLDFQFWATHADVFYSRFVFSRQISASIGVGLAY